ncbi:MAG: glyoxylate/hydroxypyruvate reductase A [Pseudomonadota bacterium]
MTITVYFAATDARWPQYEQPLKDAFEELGLEVDLSHHCDDPATVDYLVFAPNGPVEDFRPFTRAKAVLNLWAGVENVVHNPTLQIPLARMVDHGLTEGMVEYVTGHVLRYHLDMDRHFGATDWAPAAPPLARDRTVGILGLGALGTACVQALAALNFQVMGWSRRAKSLADVQSFHCDEGLDTVLAQSEILVLLLPHTPQTERLLNADTLGKTRQGLRIINPGRGALIDDGALLAALDTGLVAHATLDTFVVEPLPKDHPYWAHDNVTITPHIASETRPDSAARVIAENIRRGEAGEPLLHLVNQSAGY